MPASTSQRTVSPRSHQSQFVQYPDIKISILPEQVTIYFLKDLMAGRKKRIKGKDVKWITIPQYKALTIDKIAAYVAPHNVVADYLPVHKEICKLPKQWIANVCHTLLGAIFSNWVREQVDQRNQGILVKNNQLIDVDPEIAEAFHASTKTSGKYFSVLDANPSYACLIFVSHSSSARQRRPHAQGRLEEKKNQAGDRGPGEGQARPRE